MCACLCLLARHCVKLAMAFAGFWDRHEKPIAFTEGVSNGPRHAAAVRAHGQEYLEDLVATSAAVSQDQIKHPFMRGGLLSIPPDYGKVLFKCDFVACRVLFKECSSDCLTLSVTCLNASILVAWVIPTR